MVSHVIVDSQNGSLRVYFEIFFAKEWIVAENKKWRNLEFRYESLRID